ncbi:hypothetical protein T08_61 [Trichinella sp. T8]|nr:hypothetical protein T08_61 [Trichinella sp. T8]
MTVFQQSICGVLIGKMISKSPTDSFLLSFGYHRIQQLQLECLINPVVSGLVLLGPTFLLLVFAHAILLDRQIFVVLVFILLGRQVFVVLVFLV